MNSSPNLEKTLSLRREEKTVEKYNMKITYGIVTEERDEWVKIYRNPEGNVVTEAELRALAEELNGNDPAQRITVDWEKSGKRTTCSYVEFARFSDDEGAYAYPIELLATPEGPIMAIVDRNPPVKFDSSTVVLMDPCVVIYDGKGKINLLPIFNVARRLPFQREAIKSYQVPSEILLGMYPGFVMQNRMMQYQLKPKTAFAVSPELTNASEEAR